METESEPDETNSEKFEYFIEFRLPEPSFDAPQSSNLFVWNEEAISMDFSKVVEFKPSDAWRKFFQFLSLRFVLYERHTFQVPIEEEEHEVQEDGDGEEQEEVVVAEDGDEEQEEKPVPMETRVEERLVAAGAVNLSKFVECSFWADSEKRQQKKKKEEDADQTEETGGGEGQEE
eukprot:66565_1